MIEFITKGITKIFGTKSDKDIKKILPLVDQINEYYATLADKTDDEIREISADLKARIKEGLREFEERQAALRQEVADNPDMPLEQKEQRYDEVDALDEKANERLEVILKEILPEGFAVVKETARRLKENKQLVVTATDHDRLMAAEKKHVEIKGEQAVWYNKWLAAGTEVTWDMLHYDVQLIGGVVLHNGAIAEMATGEGKTLVATLPAFLNALAGKGVHIVTVNDYLAKRDSEWMAPLFEFHGMRVDCVDKHPSNSEERRQAYLADVTYGTNNEFGFDYLRDNMARKPEELVQRKHHYAMVDEVDSVLIDEARTPLIISGPVPKGDQHEFYELKPRVSMLVEQQKKMVGQLLNDAKRLIKEGDEKEGGLALFRCFRGMPKYKPLIKFLSEPGMRQIMQKTENFYLQDNSKMMPEADAPLYFTIEEKNNTIDLTDKGIETITKTGDDANFFILPDIGMAIAALERDESYTEAEMLQKKDELLRDYSEKSQRIHTVNQLLKAYTLFEKDTEYIIVNDKVQIVDEQTGRVMEGRRYSDGLHQAIEAKENVKIEDATQTYATITLQNYFRMYHKLAGMTGTAETEAGEFWQIYELDVVVIPTNRKISRDDRNDLVYKTAREKFNAVAEEIQRLTGEGRPVLVGTTSVEISELLSRMLNLRKIKHQVLNAKQHAREADVVAEAGKPGTVTIATNMAGRGTDIKLTPESKEAGGLAIIGTERHESRRVDRQLRGRAGRQGDVGSSQFFVSLEDNLMRMFGSDRIAKLMDRFGLEEGEVIEHSMVTSSIERAQKKVEENNFAIRKRLLEYDDVMNSQREVIYTRRKNALYGERLQVDIQNMFHDTCEDIVVSTKGAEGYDSFKLTVLSVLGMDFQITEDEFHALSDQELMDRLHAALLKRYAEKNQAILQKAMPILERVHAKKGATVENIVVPFTDGTKEIGVVTSLSKCLDTEGKELISAMEKIIALAIIDMVWKEHLRDMDDLKQSVQNAVYEQKDPLLIYKFEGFELFKRFIARVNEETVTFLVKSHIPVRQADEVEEARERKRVALNEKKEESRSLLSGGGQQGAANRPPVEKQKPIASQKVAGRNDKVTVQYQDGSIKKGVKYKTVEQDVLANKCILIDD
ncbi:MAG: preprotein translocase subunit SecA [Cyclobacteriaceae bacterium]|nr:preprotein translocase subunit SecA [Cyclobacteriaceae bacterium]MCH8516300.1 preprotein translocase subunit SecA [Cyclobacteriaceae bacterium]